MVARTEGVIDASATPGAAVESRQDEEIQAKTPPKTGGSKTAKAKTLPGSASEAGERSTDPAGDFDLSSPAFYLNRELTWLAFNRRVLNEAADSRTPLLERVKFLSIVSSNLDTPGGADG